MRHAPLALRPLVAIALLVPLLAVTRTRPSPAEAGISGAGGTAILACNLDATNAASMIIDFYRQQGPLELTMNLGVVPPLDARVVELSQTSGCRYC